MIRLGDVVVRYPSGVEVGPFRMEGPADRPWVLFGARGSGKSSLLRVLGGSLRPHRGTVEGLPIEEQRAFLPQFPERALAGRNLAEDLGGTPRPDADRRRRLRDECASLGLGGIPLSRSSRTLSAGERRRLALALLFRGPARAWAVDEPDAGLDASGRAAVVRSLAAQAAGGRRLWLATHRPELYLELSALGVILHAGRVRAAAPLADLLWNQDLARLVGRSRWAGSRLWARLRELRPEIPPLSEKMLRNYPVPIPQVEELLRDSAFRD